MNKEVIDISWEYLAGLFDGEGNICIQNNPKSSSRGISIMVFSQSEGNNADILANSVINFLKSEGITRPHYYIYNREDKRGYKRQPCHMVLIQNKWDAKIFLERVKNLCIIKKEQIDNALEFIKTLKRHYRPFTEAEKEEIKKLYLSETSQKEIAKRMGCGVSKIYKTLKEVGVSPSFGTEEWREVIRKIRRKKFTDEEFLELYYKGYTDSYIAKKLSVQKASVRDRRRALGLPSNIGKRR